MTSEESVIQPYNDWYLGIDEQETSLSEIYSNGERLVIVNKLNNSASAKQFWVFAEQ